MSDHKSERISVAFHVDIDMGPLLEDQEALSNLRPATVEYTAVWDRIKARHAYFTGRLEGECMAYMNIAKAQAKKLYGL
jgi:hypothetical protein